MNIRQNKKSVLFPLFIILIWGPILFFDSLYFAENFFDGKIITTTLVIFITFYLLYILPLKSKVLMCIMIPLSWLGEYIFSVLLDMYDYRGAVIPLYVPVGHAGVFVVGSLLTQRSFAYTQPKKFKVILISFLIISFSYAIFFLGDNFSLLLGILYLVILIRRKFSPFYLMMGLIVLYLEIIGTALGVWKWDEQQGIFTTINPPIGVAFFYVGGDIVLDKVTRLLLRQRRAFRKRISLS
ncbi:hypothetical protein ACXGQW_05945 [Wenyingzhuangia sp. IMCC45533]